MKNINQALCGVLRDPAWSIVVQLDPVNFWFVQTQYSDSDMAQQTIMEQSECWMLGLGG
jgi:hypothetical protein